MAGTGQANRPRQRTGLAASPARTRDPQTLPNTDWLRHALVITGPAAAMAELRPRLAGPGIIPWAYPDLDLDEEDQVLALVQPPDGSPGLRLAAARILARQLRTAFEITVQRRGRADRRCPLDLHAVVPVPDDVLARGPDDPASAAWLRAQWGTTQALRHVRLRDDAPDRRLRHSARLRFEFWSADWTPWAALGALRAAWPSLVFDLRPDYGRD